MGLIGSLNKAIKLAKGEYIARQDADDISLTQRLEKEVVFLNEHEDVGVVGTAASIIDENGTFLYAMPVLIENENIQERLLKKNCFVHGSTMFKRELFEKVGGYRDEFKYVEDYDLFLRIAECCKVYNLRETLYKYRFNPEGVSFSNQERQNKFEILVQHLTKERTSKYFKELSKI